MRTLNYSSSSCFVFFLCPGVKDFYDVIIFDAACVDSDGKNLSPPMSFVEETVLCAVKTLLKNNGKSFFCILGRS